MQIIKPIPRWVVVTFFIFMAYGLAQFRARQVRPSRLIILPLFTIILTLASVITGSNSRLLSLLAWLLGLGLSIWLGRLKKAPRGVHYSYQTKLIYVPGSGIPLLLMMLIYATLYIVHDVTGNQHIFMNTAEFSIAIGLIYGLICGMFLARMFSAWRVKRHRIDNLIN